MDMLKKNMVTIICGVVAVVAVAAVFWPISGYYAELQGKLEERKKVYDSLNSIKNKERFLPVVDVKNAEPRKFESFPNDTANKEAQALIDKVKASAGTMYEKAVKLNEHKLLVADSLSDRPARWNQFKSDYLRMMDVTQSQKQAPMNLRGIVNGGFPPSDAEILQKRTEKEAEIRNKAMKGIDGQITNQPMIDAELMRDLPKMADDMKATAAAACQVYLDPIPFDPSPIMSNPNPPPPGQPGGVDPSSVFNAQVGLWVHEDVCNAIAAANKGAKDVTQSAVKHLIKIDVLDEPFKTFMPGGAPTEGMPQQTGPADATVAAGDIKKVFAFSPTGRLGSANPVFDVVPFDVKMVVDASQIPRVMMELARSKFITVTNVNMLPVDSSLKHSEGYFYGDAPVVQLDLRCEALLLRNWTEKIMPLRIKQALGLAPPPAGAQPTAQ